MPPDFDSFGEMLCFLRKRKHLTQADLAKLIGVQHQTIGKYEENIIKYPPVEKLILISSIIDEEKIIFDFLANKSRPEQLHDFPMSGSCTGSPSRRSPL